MHYDSSRGAARDNPPEVDFPLYDFFMLGAAEIGNPYRQDQYWTNRIVLVTLHSPREKYWGAVQDTSPAGITLRGMDLNSLDDFARQIGSDDNPSLNIVFFPMTRIERMELDVRNGEIPSLNERFANKAGVTLDTLLARYAGG